ncbi:MAG: hypothetical protein ACQEUZ_06250 [Pseudomonadota bacterium]
MDGERALYCAVILRAALDAGGGDTATPSDRTGERSASQWEAEMWFRAAGDEFRLICYCAGFDPEIVRKAYDSGRLTKAVKIDQRWRNGREAA